MSSGQRQTQYQLSENEILRSGMTACQSPVYFFYPPDRRGARPSEHTMLQYASPEDRRRQEAFRQLQQQQYEQANGRPAHQQAETGAGGNAAYTSREAASSQAERQSEARYRRIEQPRPPRRRPTPYWLCCRNCCDPGPYSSLYAQCMGCNFPRCPNCREVNITTQEQVELAG